MRSLAYALCFILIGVPAVLSTLAWALGLLGLPLPHARFLLLPVSFSSLVPPMFAFLVPLPVHVVLAYAMLFLVLRRSWLFVARKERTPASFVGFQKVLGYIALWSFSIGLLAFALSVALKAGSGVPAAMLMLPAVLCAPWAFFITEVLSFRRPRAELAS